MIDKTVDKSMISAVVEEAQGASEQPKMDFSPVLREHRKLPGGKYA